VSFAYDVTGEGKFAIKASYGRYIGITSSPNSQPGPGGNSTGVNPIGTTSCTYNNWDGTFPFNAKSNFGPDGIMGTADDTNLSAACATKQLVNGQPSPLRTYQFASNLKPSYLNEYSAGVEIGLSRNYSVRAEVSRKFDFGNGQVLSATAGTASASTSKQINNLLPYSAYTDVRCATDPGRDGVVGTADDNLHGPVCTYSVPSSNTNRSTTNVTFANYGSNEGLSSYTSYDFTFNKNNSNGWSFLAGYSISLAHQGVQNPQTPDQMLYGANFVLASWSQTMHLNGTYAIPLFKDKWYGGLQWSSTFSIQNGDWLDRLAQVTNALGTTVVQDVDPHFMRKPEVNDWDQRITKRFKINDRQSVQFTWDLYNTMNRNYVTSYNTTNSSTANYLQPKDPVTGISPGILRPSSTGVLAPRIQQVGVTYRF